jgi:Uma2 family endonuclease
MPRKAPLRRASFEEFLALEATSSERHEFVEGLVFALAGGTDYHNRLVARILLALLPAAERAGCEAFAEGMLLKVEDAAHYPDFFVTCEEPLDGARYKKTACLVVEVLSEGTEAIDRGEKLHRYRKLPAFRPTSWSPRRPSGWRSTAVSRTGAGAMRWWRKARYPFPAWRSPWGWRPSTRGFPSSP